MVKVYVVTSGGYSDYGVDAIFDDEDLAEMYKKNFNCDVVEKYTLNPNTEMIKTTIVDMKSNGDVVETYDMMSDGQDVGFKFFYYLHHPNHDRKISWCVNTDDETKAIKVVNEKRIQILANDCWGDDKRTKELFNQ